MTVDLFVKKERELRLHIERLLSHHRAFYGPCHVGSLAMSALRSKISCFQNLLSPQILSCSGHARSFGRRQNEQILSKNSWLWSETVAHGVESGAWFFFRRSVIVCAMAKNDAAPEAAVPTLIRMPRISDVLASGEVGERLSLSGWVRSRRDSKAGLSFIALNDGSSLASMQVIAQSTLDNYDTTIKGLSTGAAIRVEGTLVESPGQEQRVELEAAEITCIGEAPNDYPLQKKRHTLEYLREIAHLRPRTNAIGATMRVRHQLAQSIHTYFRDRGFVYVHTPIITASDAEGAGELFRVSTLPAAQSGPVDWDKDFFARQTFLTVSGQLQGEALATALGRIYTFGPTFRAENSNTARHAAEFWMVEPEMAFCNIDLNAEVAEDFLRSVVRDALEHCEADLAFFDLRIEKGLVNALEHVANTSFERLTYSEAIEKLAAANTKFEYTPQWGKPLQTEHERYLSEELLKKPVIVTDYPGDNAAFYMRLNDDGKTVRGMDVLVPRIGEIIGGSEREERYDVLRKRMAHHGISEEEYQWYLDLRKYGSVPHAGFGLGFERLVMFVTGMKNIRDVIAFPRTPRSARF